MPISNIIEEPALTDSGKSALALDYLSRGDFERLAHFIQDYSGIKMSPSKKTMVEGRLRRRVKTLGLPDLTAYCRLLFDQKGLAAETIHLIDAVTTNKTDFFREPGHFDFMTETAVPALLGAPPGRPRAPLKIWSAACSIGAEPYTLAMVCSNLARLYTGLDLTILATDICTEVLAKAVCGIYPASMIEPVPVELRRRYMMRGKGHAADRVRIVPELRRMVHFGRLNLMDECYPVATDMHIIFCRNILIYFDKKTQHRVLDRLCSHLRTGGYLFLGHSESLAGMGLPLVTAGSSVFRKT